MKPFWLVLGVVLLGGCMSASTPPGGIFFPDVSPRAAIPARFAARLAPRFEQVSAVTFSFHHREMTSLGISRVDIPAQSFAVSCLSPLGVKFFDVVCENGQVETRFVHPEFAKVGGDLGQAAGSDLKRAFFDWQPPEGTEGRIRNGQLVFSAEEADGVTDYHYVAEGRLAGKIRHEKGKLQWAVNYLDYQTTASGLVPTKIVVINHRFKYRLSVSARE